MTGPLHGMISSTAAIGAALVATSASAQTTADDRFWLEASAYFPRVNSSVEANSTANPAIGTKIDLASDLHLDNDATLPAFQAGVRVSRNFTIIGEYYSIGRDSTSSLQRSITFEGVTYPVAASVTSSFDTNVYRLVLGYSFVHNDTVEVGGALGVHATKFKFGIEGMGSVGSAAAQIEQRREDFLAPLPTVGLFANFQIAPRLTLGARADYLSLKIGDYKGRLLNAEASIEYRAMKNIGIGANYRHVNYRVEADKERFEGTFKYKFTGPSVFVRLAF